VFDALIANPGRLRILTALATEPSQEFVRLRAATELTDGNLATHARRLRLAGLLAIDKSFRSGRPVTTITLTETGRNALRRHVDHVIDALGSATSRLDRASVEPASADRASGDPQEDWVD
jgi:DNA-binding MarR family transcriptional regulator